MSRTTVDREHLHLKIVQEISDFVNKSTGLNTILKGVVSKISESLHFEVVSVYIIDGDNSTLRLRANTGFDSEEGAEITISSGEGIAGMIFKTMRPFVTMNVSGHPKYKPIDNTGEEKYECYLGVPIVLKNHCVGVLVGQTSQRRHITPAEQTLFEIIASRLAGLLEVADTLDRLHTPAIVEHKTRTYQGKGASSGIAVGNAFLIRGLFGSAGMFSPPPQSADKEKKRLLEAFSRVEKDMKDLIGVLRKDDVLSASEIEIFEAHLMLLSSESSDSVRGVVILRVEEGDVSAETAVVQGIESIAGRFEHHSDRYVREKAQDFRDIGEKLLHELVGLKENGEEPSAGSGSSTILVAREIGPSFVSMLGKNKIAGVITERGGETSHAVIIAKSLGIPVVIGIENICGLISSGDKVIVDGRTGFVFINPDEMLVKEYENSGRRIEEIRHLVESDEKVSDVAREMTLTANIGFPDDIETAVRHGVSDVGLFRTEFAFARFEKPPGVDEQTKIYGDISRKFGGRITVRTLDIGADKVLPYFNIPEEENPLLGLRAIRFSMEYLDLFREQIKSIMLAAVGGARLRILLPMVSNIWEVETAKQIMDDTASEAGLAPDKVPPLGVMLEVPALVPLINEYAEIVDFISVGTNDLVQYLLAVDRNSNVVGHLYSSFHPAVLRVLDTIRKSSDRNSLEVSICGEMAGSPKGALLIFALGYKNLSVSPYRIPVVKFIANHTDAEFLAGFRRKLMRAKNEADIKRLLANSLENMDSALLEFD
ncbi:phosphoenolpyruvate--protein phosphotransferase [Candidatus Mycalebacterium sp.]